MELFEMTAASLSEKLRKKECSAVEITRSVLEQIEKTEYIYLPQQFLGFSRVQPISAEN